MSSVSSTTFKLSLKRQGFEADESYDIQNVEQMQGVEKGDLQIQPPPDIAVEVDISRSSVLKMKTIAGLSVPEVWRYRDDKIAIEILEGNQYVKTESSVALAEFPLRLASDLILQRSKLEENEIIDRFLAGLE